MKTRRIAGLFVVAGLVFLASCTSLPYDTTARGYGSLGMFSPNDENISDFFGSGWLSFSGGVIGPVAERIQGRAEVQFTMASEYDSYNDYDVSWFNMMLRAGGVYMLDQVQEDAGPYVGGTATFAIWDYDDYAGTESGIDPGISVIVGYRFKTEREDIDWFIEAIYDIVSYSGEDLDVDEIGGLSILIGIIF